MKKKQRRRWVSGKIVRIMKTTSFLMLVVCGSALAVSSAPDANAQQVLEKKVTISFQKLSLKEGLRRISGAAGIPFTFTNEVAGSSAVISVSANGLPLKDVLQNALEELPFSFEATPKRVLIRYEPSTPKIKLLQQLPVSEQQVRAEAVLKEISGRVTDEKGEALPGVNITVTGANVGAVTDVNGRFSLSLKDNGNVQLVFSFVGYVSKKLALANQSTIEISLEPDSRTLSEVVVTGVAEGTSRKKLAFALTRIGEDQINTVPGTDASQTLRGKIAGIQIDQAGGNQQPTIYLRGAKSVYGNVPPLLVVDGFVTALSLSDLNPQDIEAIEVVKGASASALYGTRGEGGVIQVITRKGKGRLSIVVDNEVGSSSLQRKIATNQQHFYKVNTDGSFVLNGNVRAVDYQSNGFSVNLHPFPQNNDNLGSLFQSSPYFTNFVSVSNSGEKYKLYASFQNQHKGSIVTPLKSPDTRQTATVNLGYRPTDRLETEATFQYFSNSRPSASIAVPTSFTGGSYNNTSLYAALTYEPYINLAEKGEDGKYLSSPTGTSYSVNRDVPNPFYAISTREYSNKSDNIFTGIKLKYHLLDNLSAEVYGAIQKEFTSIDDYYPIGYQTPVANVTLNNGYYGVSSLSLSSRNLQAQLNYREKFGEIDFGATLKAVYEESKLTGVNASGYTLTAPVKSLAVSAINTREISNVWEKTINYGYFLNAKASYRDKLFLDVLGRLDQSSRFGNKVATAFFPRVSAAYRLTEDFKLGPVSELKLRAAYGQAGTLPPFGAKDSQVTITNSGGISYTQNANTDLKRAVTEEFELGIDAELFNRIYVQANYAFANSKNDFIQVPPFPPTSGSARIYSNLGAVKSNSLELEISGNAIEKKNFSWRPGFTFSKVTSKVTSLGDVPEFTEGGFRKSVGYNPLEYYGPKYLTSLSELETNSEGFVINAGNGTLRPDDFAVNSVGFVVQKSLQGTAAELPVAYVNAATGNQTYLGSAQPNFILGFSNTINLGRFSLYGVLDWKNGGYKRNRTQQLITYRYRSVITEDILKAGLPLAFVDAVYGGEQYLWVEKSGYVSLREISVGYSIPVEKLFDQSKAVRAARLAVTGRNLFIWSKYNGVSPEGLYDRFDYPNYRIISAKLTVSF